MDELIALLKKVDIRYKRKELHWADAWCKWVVSTKYSCPYRGDSLIEALKILTKET